ncbi:MAG: rhomboid family intramembrane serine protease, partial [Verrucomicrobiota bacterium]
MIPLRDENPTRITPYFTWLLIAANIAIYGLQILSGMHEGRTGLIGGISGWTMVPVEVTQGIDVSTNGRTLLQPFWLTIFTSMFMHGGLLHLGGNMLFLLIFGNNIEDALGHTKYIAFYLACGVLAAFAQIASNPDSVIPTLGA